jgi:adenosylcobinamide amidohydrolase
MKRLLIFITLTSALLAQERFTTRRVGHFFVVELARPHRVLSTSPFAGGQKDGIRYLVNHQSMEAAGDLERHAKVVGATDQQYHEQAARTLSVPAAEMVLMGTAANMNCLAHRREEFRELQVDVFVTAGVEGNATRAGDPTTFYEQPAPQGPAPPHGTINTILIVNRPLTPAALARAVVTMTEGKSAALAELATPSGVSAHLATGTGTDQFIIAAPTEGGPPLRWSGSHSKLGELIGDAVRAATREALRWQNGLEPSYTRNITRALGRFGLSETELLARLKLALPAASFDLLAKNKLALIYEPRLAAAAYAYAAVLDRLQYGTIPTELADEVLRDQAASVAVALSANPARWSAFWDSLPAHSADRLDYFVRGLVMGWRARWAE